MAAVVLVVMVVVVVVVLVRCCCCMRLKVAPIVVTVTPAGAIVLQDDRLQDVRV